MFYEHLPFYLSVGMTAAEYWRGDSTLVGDYRRAHRMKQERENEKLWLQGLYFYDALCASPQARAFLKEECNVREYPDRPYPVTESEARQRQAQREKAAYELQKSKAMANIKKFNKSFNGGES